MHSGSPLVSPQACPSLSTFLSPEVGLAHRLQGSNLAPRPRRGGARGGPEARPRPGRIGAPACWRGPAVGRLALGSPPPPAPSHLRLLYAMTHRRFADVAAAVGAEGGDCGDGGGSGRSRPENLESAMNFSGAAAVVVHITVSPCPC